MICLGKKEFHDRRRPLITLLDLRNMHRYSKSFELLISTASRSKESSFLLVLRADSTVAIAKLVVFTLISLKVSKCVGGGHKRILLISMAVSFPISLFA